MEKVEKNSWSVFGRRLKSKTNGTFDEGTITIQEQDSNLLFRTRSASQQRPLPDPNLGAATPKDSFGVAIDAPLAVRLIQNALSTTALFLSSFFSTEKLNETDKKTQSFFEGVVDLSYGITFDRGIMLKLLSQPNCEGLRAYLCSREDQGDYHVSLVMVGVDVDGYDLNYGPDETKIGEITTNSLLVEYGYPPGGRTIVNRADTAIDDHYALLKYAVENV